ncbi:MAG: chromosome segregation protein SMC, partial [Sulfobacillus benefaciens]
MHLHKVVIYGFKSFAKETQIILPPGITALVGPNGGGKSNVVDAIRWALGEQKVRELRAEKWDELLYVGGPGRPSARLAEVSLHFDNADQKMPSWPEELVITRRYYRSGDSEYLINGRVVRLRDVSDMLLDSGLGRFSYAIISQGRVEATLTQKPRERLEQLEEAAGVSRYKVRKRETLLHLQEVNSNVARLSDLQGETGRQMEELSQQAEQERQYLAWQSERQRWQTQIQHTKFRNAQKALGKLQQQRDSQVANLAELAQELSAHEIQVQTVRESAEKVQEAMMRAESQWRHWDKEVTQLEQQEAVMLSKLEGLTGEKERLGTELQEIEGQAVRLRHEALQLTDRSNHHSSEWQGQLVTLEQKIAQLEHEVQEVAEELDLRRRTTAQRDIDLGLIKQSLARWQGVLGTDSLDSLAEAMDFKRTQVRQMEREVQQLSQELQQLTEKRQQLERFRHHTEQELLPLRHQLAQRQARLRALHQLEAEGEGLPLGVRAILQAQRDQKLEGILGTVGSLLTSDPDVALAIQIALGNASHDVIVEHESQARRAVRFLQAQALGRATFLPLDTIRPGLVPDGERSLNRLQGVVGWALDVVHFERSLRPAISHLLGRVLVLKTLDTAMTVGAHHRFRYKMVTLDGQLVHAGGAITGGHHGQRDSRSSRVTEIQTLTQRVAEDLKIIEGKEELLKASLTELRETEILLDGARERLSERRHH